MTEQLDLNSGILAALITIYNATMSIDEIIDRYKNLIQK